MSRWLFIWLSVAGFGVIFYIVTSTHRFVPNPLRPRECARCGRARDKHTTV